jgi:GxxExxY protein
VNRQDDSRDPDVTNRQDASAEGDPCRDPGDRGDLGELNRQGAKDAKEPAQEVDDVARAVIGAAIEVHRHLGPGFLESVYEEALAVELTLRGIGYERQVPIWIAYKGQKIGESRLDLVVEDELVVEIKAVDSFVPVHTAQVISYLKAGGFELGLLMNFNSIALREGIRRIIRTR